MTTPTNFDNMVTPQKFTKKAALASVCDPLCIEFEQSHGTPELVLMNLIRMGGVTTNFFRACDADETAIRSALETYIKSLPKRKQVRESDATKEYGRLMNTALAEAQKLGDKYISIEHLLLALSAAETPGGNILREHGVTRDALLKSLIAVRGYNQVEDKEPEGRYPTLRQFAKNLTADAAMGKLDPVIGRSEEIALLMEVLCCRTKNNPVLVGEPGIGKSAIVEGLAQRIAQGDVPEPLKNKKIFALDLPAMQAGAGGVGEFETRMKGVMKDVIESKGDVFLFIDEMHVLMSVGGKVDASNMLKPALARGELHCIGASTFAEYRKTVEKDKALERRFQKIVVEEPSVEDTISILRGVKGKYEMHHSTRIKDSALVKAAELSHRYLPERKLPDKAIDLIDQAGARHALKMNSKPDELDKLDREKLRMEIEIEALKKEQDEDSQARLAKLKLALANISEEAEELRTRWEREKSEIHAIRELKQQIEKLDQEIAEASRENDVAKLAPLMKEKKPEAEAKLRELLAGIKKQGDDRLLKNEVDENDIAEVIERLTKIPATKQLEGDETKLLRLEQYFEKRVIGQNEAKKAIGSAVRRSRAGLADPNKPIGSFMFLGPTGVGKTELTKALAEFLFDDESRLVRIDMSEYMEKHSVSRLIGSPPGYVGYDEGGQLTEAVRKTPYTVVLFDEIEKAHPDVFNILLQVLDDGRLTDGQGRTVDFRNTLIIMTSNLGSDKIIQSEDDSYDALKKLVMTKVKSHFRPEFINRIDEVVVFHKMTMEMMEAIARIHVKKLCKRALENRGITIKPTDHAMKMLAAKGYDPEFGARPLKRVIQNRLEEPLSEKILAKVFKKNDIVTIDWDENDFSFTNGDVGSNGKPLPEPEAVAPKAATDPGAALAKTLAAAESDRDEGPETEAGKRS